MWILDLIGGGVSNNKPQWTVLRHNGPFFPPNYIVHNTPVIINNKEVILPPEAEEYATMYAKYLDTPYMESNIFKKNFWKDFASTVKSLNIKCKRIALADNLKNDLKLFIQEKLGIDIFNPTQVEKELIRDYNITQIIS